MAAISGTTLDTIGTLSKIDFRGGPFLEGRIGSQVDNFDVENWLSLKTLHELLPGESANDTVYENKLSR